MIFLMLFLSLFISIAALARRYLKEAKNLENHLIPGSHLGMLSAIPAEYYLEQLEKNDFDICRRSSVSLEMGSEMDLSSWRHPAAAISAAVAAARNAAAIREDS